MLESEKKCKYCAMTIPKEAKICPFCRKKLGWTLPAKIFALSLLFIVIVSAYTNLNEKPVQTTMKSESQAKVSNEVPDTKQSQIDPAVINHEKVLKKLADMSAEQKKGVLPEAGALPEKERGGKSHQNGPTLIDFSWATSEYGTKYITGSVKNNSDKSYKYAQISFMLYDDDDAQVGSAFANINNLESNGTWKFKAIVLEKTAKKAKFAKITAF
jgi:hypothetical protein